MHRPLVEGPTRRTPAGCDASAEDFANTAPPVVFSTQAVGFVELKTPRELQAWEEALRTTTGLEISADSLAGHACETR